MALGGGGAGLLGQDRLDLRTHGIERLDRSRRHLVHMHHVIAVIVGQGGHFAGGALDGLEDGAQHVRREGRVAERLAIGVTAALVDRIDLDGVQADRFGGLVDVVTAADAVLELGGQGVEAVGGLVLDQILDDAVLDLGERPGLAGDHRGDAQGVPAEGGLHRADQRRAGRGEGGVAQLGQRHVGL